MTTPVKSIFDRVLRGGMQVLIITAIFYGGIELGSIKQRLDTLEKGYVTIGAKDAFVPRIEIANDLKAIREDIKEIKQDIKDMKNEY